MNTVKVKTKDLLRKIKKNRDAHRDLFLKAQAGFRRMAIEELDAMLKDARDGRPIRTHLNMVPPMDHTDDYDGAIARLEMCVDEEVTIDSHSFDMYVRDKWDWKAHVDATNTMYAARAIR